MSSPPLLPLLLLLLLALSAAAGVGAVSEAAVDASVPDPPPKCDYDAAETPPAVSAAVGLALRVLGEEQAQRFCFRLEESPPSSNEGHWYVSGWSGDGPEEVLVEGTDAVSMAAGLHHYLKYEANCSISWWGDQLNLPTPLPAPHPPLEGSTPFQYRYYMNTCTFGYSTVWWDWARWQREIDWMALHGINTPLAPIGQESVWQSVFVNQFQLQPDDLLDFFSGPAFLPWNRMGNLDSWGGPLPAQWINAQPQLQKLILGRMRQLGMSPVLPAFSGFVPAAFARKYPHASVRTSSVWGNFLPTYQLSPTDPLFAEVQQAFVSALTTQYDTDSLYSVDLWNELLPPSDNPADLKALSQAVYASLQAADPDAVWVMQGWLFVNEPDFWGPDQIKAVLHAVPRGNLLVLDLWSEVKPVWNGTDSYYDTPFVWNMLHNFGGRSGLYARMPEVAVLPQQALLSNATSGALRGLGLTPEAIDTSPVVYDLMMENVYTGGAGHTNLTEWVHRYAERRYGLAPTPASPQPAGLAGIHDAWSLLLQSVFSCPTQQEGTSGSVIAARPAFNLTRASCCDTLELYYDPADVVQALQRLLAAAEEHPDLLLQETFNSDVVAVTSQAASNLALQLYHNASAAYGAGSLAHFNDAVNTLVAVMDALDALLATQQRWMLGTWLSDAGNKALEVPTVLDVGFSGGGGGGVARMAAETAAAESRAGPGGAHGGPHNSDGTLGCTVDPTLRQQCGQFADLTQAECVAQGCCYDPSFSTTALRGSAGAHNASNTGAAPACFYRQLSPAKLYELNARTQVTLWGPSDSPLTQYAYKLWSGLVADFYKPRWQLWADSVGAALRTGQPFDEARFLNATRVMEEKWTQQTNPYPTTPTGDSVLLASEFYSKFLRS